jgi:hypothetical protein
MGISHSGARGIGRRRHHGELGAPAGAAIENSGARCSGTRYAVCPHELQEDDELGAPDTRRRCGQSAGRRPTMATELVGGTTRRDGARCSGKKKQPTGDDR